MSQLSGLNSIKIGVDFGTTYSGIAWAHTATPDEINVVDRWVTGRNRTSAKVPSEIAYTPAGVKWGFGIPNKDPRLAWFKLLLDPTKYSLANATNSPLTRTKQSIPRGKKPVDVVADYLSELYKHTIDHLEKTLGKDVVDVSPLDFTLTVPAVWSDAAKNLTLQAAKSAGFGRNKSIRLISEPEAAAVCCLKEIEPNNLNIGDTFVVADCGGGTVDVISYTITKKSPKLEVVECVEGTGAMCGSTALNEGFEKLVRDRIGNRFDKMKHEGRLRMMDEFNDSLKRNFADSNDEDIYMCVIPGVEDDIDARVEDGLFIINREEMRKIFDPVVEEVVQLVQQQVKEVERLRANIPLIENEWLYLDTHSPNTFSRRTCQVKALVLVGGFGESEYLRTRLQAEVRTNDGREVPILQPPNAWTAVVRGAVMRGLEGEMVRIRKVTRNYGKSCRVPFVEGFHPESDRIISRHDGKHKCQGRMHWYIRKGEDVQEDDPVRKSYYINLDSLDGIHESSLLASDSTNPSDTQKSPDVYTVCNLEVDLSVIPKEKFERKIGINGQPYFKLSFDILISIQSASILFEFDVDGVVYRDVRARFPAL